MVQTAWAELSFAASRTLGIPFSQPALDAIIEALREGRAPSELLSRPKLDGQSQRDVDLRRFRLQAERAARQTSYYGDVFTDLGLDPGRLEWEDIGRIPTTPKEALRDRPYDFVCRDAKPVFRTTTTGTTGRPTSLCFSAYEMKTYISLFAISNLVSRDILPDDVLLISWSRGIGNACALAAFATIGAVVLEGGIVDPEITLAKLTEEHRLPGKHSRVSLLATYPSYLGELVERGLELGYKPSDFGLRRIDIGGELVTEGVKERARKLFGPVPFASGYGMTETWPLGAESCPEGHLHFAAGLSLVEVLDQETGEPVAPGETGTVVATPLPPYRETTLVLRYDTQDAVQTLAEPPTCAASDLYAIAGIRGKLKLAVRHEDGWTFPADVLEALEAIDAVPLPARCGFWAVPGGVAVEVVPRRDSAAARGAIEHSLEEHGVPLRELHLRADRSELEHPLPLRCDLRETSFAPTAPPTARRRARAAAGRAQT